LLPAKVRRRAWRARAVCRQGRRHDCQPSAGRAHREELSLPLRSNHRLVKRQARA
jgi:hypothetical protein